MSDVMAQLEAVIQERKRTLPEDSYSAALFAQGINRIAQKVGEEGVEVVVAALAEDSTRLTSELADLTYHCLMLLAAKNLSWRDVEAELEARFG